MIEAISRNLLLVYRADFNLLFRTEFSFKISAFTQKENLSNQPGWICQLFTRQAGLLGKSMCCPLRQEEKRKLKVTGQSDTTLLKGAKNQVNNLWWSFYPFFTSTGLSPDPSQGWFFIIYQKFHNSHLVLDNQSGPALFSALSDR